MKRGGGIKQESRELSVVEEESFRILCVEDEVEILNDVVFELQENGFVVESAANGKAALDTLEHFSPDLIISDILMPVMGGKQLLQEVRALPGLKGAVPFIFLTAFGDRDSVIDGRREGADDYLVKPIDYALLLAVVSTHVHNARRRAAEAEQQSGVWPVNADALSRLTVLNPRERDILIRMAEGKPNKIIAYDLGLSVRTVEVYRANLLKRLGVRSTTEAVKLAFAAGLVEQ